MESGERHVSDALPSSVIGDVGQGAIKLAVRRCGLARRIWRCLPCAAGSRAPKRLGADRGEPADVVEHAPSNRHVGWFEVGVGESAGPQETLAVIDPSIASLLLEHPIGVVRRGPAWADDDDGPAGMSVGMGRNQVARTGDDGLVEEQQHLTGRGVGASIAGCCRPGTGLTRRPGSVQYHYPSRGLLCLGNCGNRTLAHFVDNHQHFPALVGVVLRGERLEQRCERAWLTSGRDHHRDGPSRSAARPLRCRGEGSGGSLVKEASGKQWSPRRSDSCRPRGW